MMKKKKMKDKILKDLPIWYILDVIEQIILASGDCLPRQHLYTKGLESEWSSLPNALHAQKGGIFHKSKQFFSALSTFM